MDVITAQLATLNGKIEKLEARRDAAGISQEMYALHTNEIVALRNQAAALENRAAALENRAAAQFPAGMV